MIKWIGIIVFLMLLVGSASCATLTVDDSGGADYTKIQDAIDNASAGDTILVQSGTYLESLNVNKPLILKGVDTGGGIPVVDSANPVAAHITLNYGGSTIEGFKVINNYGDAGIMVYSNNNILKNNVVLGDEGNAAGSGIWLYHYSDNNTISGNIVNLHVMGLNLWSSNNNTINSNFLANNGHGISLYKSNNNTVYGNSVTSNTGDGLSLFYSRNNSLIANNLDFNGASGLSLNDNSGYNMVIGNTINSNYWGIVIVSEGNTVKDNVVSNNNPYGSILDIYNNSNIIYNNIFNIINFNIYSGFINTWNTTKTSGMNIKGGPYLGGNYWASPDGTGFSQTCTDTDSDGICDLPYVLDANNTDFMPLAYSIGIHTNSVGYNAVVATGQNTIVESSDGSFGPLMKGETKTISNSVVLNNTGDISAIVEARLNDSIGGVFGLINGTNLLNATNFKLGQSGALVPLLDSGDNVLVATASPGVTALDARLEVPSDAVAGDYSGKVVLTFSNDV